jgi:bifunctional UDP-N-acetylglucosamine pyrophosphorylase/glucosamine-1-phosphate N-acetyltransferase
MAGGATLIDPATVWLSVDTRLAEDVVVGPNVVFGPGVKVDRGAEIHAFCHLEGVTIEPGAVVGPFARLRPGTVIGQGARVGNFVEVKNATLEAGAKANHLSYLGDARVGAKANVGAGTITCNYDGFLKHHTDIGAGAFIGSNTALVAPVRVGAGAIVGAGSTLTRDVAADALATARGEQREYPGAAGRLRRRKTAEKARKRNAAD